MSQPQWAAVDSLLGTTLVPQDEVLRAALSASETAGLAQINVTANQGKFLQILAQACGARRILEVGTLGGYSGIWLARALPEDGRLITLEIDPHAAAVARANFARAGVADQVELRLGPAIDTLPKLVAERAGPFDFIFIDADKPSNSMYFDWALKLARIGTLMVVDNVIREGAILDPASTDENVQGVHRLLARLAAEPRINVSAIQTVGSKGYDGFAIAVVVA